MMFMADILFEKPSKEQEKKLMEFIFDNSNIVKFFAESVLSAGHKKKLHATLKEMEKDFIMKDTESPGFLPIVRNEYYVFMLSKKIKDSIKKEGLFMFDMEGGPLYSLTEPAFYKDGKMIAEVDCSGCRSVLLHLDDGQIRSLKSLGLKLQK
jgi:hypothetical protein